MGKKDKEAAASGDGGSKEQPKSIRRTMTKRNSVIDMLETGQQVCVSLFGLVLLGEVEACARVYCQTTLDGWWPTLLKVYFG